MPPFPLLLPVRRDQSEVTDVDPRVRRAGAEDIGLDKRRALAVSTPQARQIVSRLRQGVPLGRPADVESVPTADCPLSECVRDSVDGCTADHEEESCRNRSESAVSVRNRPPRTHPASRRAGIPASLGGWQTQRCRQTVIEFEFEVSRYSRVRRRRADSSRLDENLA